MPQRLNNGEYGRWIGEDAKIAKFQYYLAITYFVLRHYSLWQAVEQVIELGCIFHMLRTFFHTRGHEKLERGRGFCIYIPQQANQCWSWPLGQGSTQQSYVQVSSVVKWVSFTFGHDTVTIGRVVVSTRCCPLTHLQKQRKLIRNR